MSETECGANDTGVAEEASAVEGLRKGEPAYIQVTLKIEGRNTAELMASVDRRGKAALEAVSAYVASLGRQAFGDLS